MHRRQVRAKVWPAIVQWVHPPGKTTVTMKTSSFAADLNGIGDLTQAPLLLIQKINRLEEEIIRLTKKRWMRPDAFDSWKDSCISFHKDSILSVSAAASAGLPCFKSWTPSRTQSDGSLPWQVPSSQDWNVCSHSSHSHSFQQCPVRYRRWTWKPCTLHAHLKSLQKSGCQAYPSLWLWVQLGFETLHLLLSFLGG